jgi:hypothetical protein
MSAAVLITDRIKYGNLENLTYSNDMQGDTPYRYIDIVHVEGPGLGPT